ncbi:hypothetical protein BC938DRAFT_473756 [Jimgerdemannia flammicorona]|nr:hypothetical protein BC938DRAFT_473756 [Jimgerdemannia flammicorona]
MSTYGFSLPKLRALNIVSLLAFVIGMLVAKPDLADIFYDHPTFLTPATWVMSLFWGLELLLLSAFVTVQYGDDLNELIGEGVGVWFVVANTLISVWIYFWVCRFCS